MIENSMPFKSIKIYVWASLFVLLDTSRLYAEEALVAVATNFVSVAEQLAFEYEQVSDHEISIIAGSTGRLYTQIIHGAPFDIFLAADTRSTQLLAEQDLAISSTRKTYATGRLALISKKFDLTEKMAIRVLKSNQFRHLALPNPQLAPYGVVSREVLQNLGLLKQLESKLVYGESVGQTYSFISTGNAELGFVSQSYIWNVPEWTEENTWIVPKELHQPLVQESILLLPAMTNLAAIGFYDFIFSKRARLLISSFGYEYKN